MGARTAFKIFLLAILAGEESCGKGIIGDDAKSICRAQVFKFAFICLALGKVVQRLEDFVTRAAVPAGIESFAQFFCSVVWNSRRG